MHDTDTLSAPASDAVRAVELEDLDGFLRCFGHDGFVDVNGTTFDGADGIRAWFTTEIVGKHAVIALAGSSHGVLGPTVDASLTVEGAAHPCRIRFVVYEGLIQSMRITLARITQV